MKESATVKIFLVDGDPVSVRTAEISNWTGKAIAGPRTQLDAIRKRHEAGKPGVYFLSGVSPESGKPKVYVGEAEDVRKRLADHLSLDFWKTVVLFVSKDENLTKAHVKYLEGKLIERTKEAGRFELHNTNGSGARLPESDAADMDVFFQKIEQLLPVLGQDFLKPMQQSADPTASIERLYCSIKGLRATGQMTDNGFLVLKESEAVLEERPSTKNYPYPSALRSSLVHEGVLCPAGDRYVFAKDYEFSSPSAAASVVHGGHANGLREWKSAAGVPLKELEQKEVAGIVGLGDIQ